MNQPLRFRDELRDFWCFLRRPNLSPRLPNQDLGKGWHTDWTNGLGVKRMLQWAGFLWLINITVFGPLAAMVATSSGAEHKLDLSNIPWKQAVLWAPLVEEMVFRYVLRRPSQFLWVLPVTVWCLFTGPQTLTVAILAVVIFLLFVRPRIGIEMGQGFKWQRRWNIYYARHFGWAFYGSTLLFAAVHLYNFKFSQIPLLILPLLILPQFVTGLTLAWLRVRRGIGASIILHAVFNSGPILLIMLVMSLMPELST